MANASFSVNIIPKSNTLTIGNSDSPWTIVNPTLTGTPTAPTPDTETNNGQIATTEFVHAAIQGEALPTVTASDNGKFLRVVSGLWAAARVNSAEGVGF